MVRENRPARLTDRRGTDVAFGWLGEEMERTYDREGRRQGIMALEQKLDYLASRAHRTTGCDTCSSTGSCW